MQTFLPYSDFKKTAECLDNKRLGKQRVEAYTILKVLLLDLKPWKNHPAVKMWRGNERLLLDYGLEICNEWKRRGFSDSCAEKMKNLCKNSEKILHVTIPLWLGDERLHASHRSNLLRKNYQHYSMFGWSEPESLPYFWPEK